jgi:Cysteine-rich CWC
MIDLGQELKPSRTLACARCGSVFECQLAGDCWCAAEPYRLPLTSEGAAEDCLCPDCLRKAAALQEKR